MATLQQRWMTFADLLAQPEDGFLHELVRGEILRMPPPKGMHGRIEARLTEALGRYLYDRARGMGWHEAQGIGARDELVGSLAGGEFGIRISLPDDPDQVRGLDVCYLSPEQVARYEASGSDDYFAEVPVLVAEVISPSETVAYINEKVNDYLAGGARLVWLLFPNTHLVQIYQPDGSISVVRGSNILGGEDVLPGFAVPLSNIFST